NASESSGWRRLSLAGRPRVRKFLRSLSRREAVGMGDILAGGGLLQLDYRSVDPGHCYDEGPASSPSSSAIKCAFLGVLLWIAVGSGRAYVWSYHALSWAFARNGCSARPLRCIRHTHAADLSRRVHERSSGNIFRAHHSSRHWSMPGWNYGSGV